MALELGPQAPCRFRLETAQTPIPRPESYKTTTAMSTLAFPAVGGASHSAARASRIGRQCAQYPASTAQNRMWSARGRACSPCAARWRSRAGLCRDRSWPSSAPRPDVHNRGAEGRLPDWRGRHRCCPRSGGRGLWTLRVTTEPWLPGLTHCWGTRPVNGGLARGQVYLGPSGPLVNNPWSQNTHCACAASPHATRYPL